MAATPILFASPNSSFSPDVFATGRIVLDGQMLQVPPSPTVRQMVTENPRLARVFEKYGLSYCCCGGNKTVLDACAELGVNVDALLTDLRRVTDAQDTPGSEEADWYDAKMGDHARHLMVVHHAHLHSELPRVAFLLNRVTNRHGELYVELWELESVFQEFRHAVEAHLKLQEEQLFPLLMRLEDGRPQSRDTGAMLRDLIGQLRNLHANITDALSQMHQITDGFSSPSTACNTYRVLMQSLRDLSADLLRHLNEEETLLFPRALAAVTVECV